MRARKPFCHGILGLPVAAGSDKLGMTFFSLGSPHCDLAITEVVEDAPLADGNRIELYVDQSDVWKQDPAAVASYKPLTL